jgi:hypothetical protein
LRARVRSLGGADREVDRPGLGFDLIVNTFFFAVLFVCLGILGEYLARIFENVKSRPRFIVDETVNGPASGGAPPRR